LVSFMHHRRLFLGLLPYAHFRVSITHVATSSQPLRPLKAFYFGCSLLFLRSPFLC
jgi:hypothetical protein